METLWEAYKSKAWVEPFLIYSVVLFMAVSLILYVSIIRSRAKKIRNAKLHAEYTTIIEKILFSTLFEDVSYASVQKDTAYTQLQKDKFFREQLGEAVLNLHKNYEGAYAKKIERFYYESGLLRDSFKKLKSQRWEITCRGVQELAEMNITKAFSSIVKVSGTRNKTLKITALNACIKLSGTKGITHLVDHSDPIDDWTQVNIIAALRQHDVDDTEGIELLLSSQNTSVVTLGLKIIKALQLSRKAPFVAHLITTAPNTHIKFEAQNVLQSLTN